ncbi:Peregrin AltName: Full=Bromodomain and PHD finger-containing protein 1 [Rhizoctonia solani AG-1 IB]|uniref:BRD16203 protein n=1 Tax=Thanatephorus cucumeris (strain AG1-IB / isolate 7/3/14) TaxID=1108050 RepID=M5BRN3_THACB|nr:Peregrin AltName: Full=Bromodomain and PHD finger-containing protein 1 [Rhizoctonia solani AG-1 IB]
MWEFRKCVVFIRKEFDGVDDKLAQQYGYNEVNVTFERPEHYIRYVDPVESELLTQVEYDMDEQDEEWLKEINSERYKEQSERISAETFEIIIDRLEKEWFELMKRVPKPDQALPSEDSTCAVCDDGEGENANAIVTMALSEVHRVTGNPGGMFIVPERRRKKRPFLLAVCKYWSLKREARRGAPLLKRLHLEPWATSMTTQLQTDEDKLKYLDNLNKLRDDLKRVLQLADLVRQREVEKQNQAHVVETLVTSCLLPFDIELRKTYEKVVGLDRANYFMNPVSRTEVPEYYTVIDQPMHWLGIGEKIEQHEYLDSQAFVDDVCLVLDNALKYNKKDTPFYKAALRIKNHAQPILDEFRQIVQEKSAQWMNQELTVLAKLDEPKPPTDRTNPDGHAYQGGLETSRMSNDLVDFVPVEASGQHLPPSEAIDLEEEIIPGTPNAEPAEDNQIFLDEQTAFSEVPEPVEKLKPPVSSQVGDMEPYPLILHMLQEHSSVADDLPFLLTSDPLTSFFSYRKLVPKPPPPPPPQAKQPRKSSRKKRVSDAPATHPQRVVLLVREPQTSETVSLLENVPESAATSTPTSSRPPKRKRQDSDSWGQVVSDVNPHESFMLFETGWVLPPGVTRSRRPTFPGGPKPNGTESRKQSKEPKRTRTSSSIRGDTQPPTIVSSRQTSQVPPVEVQTPVEEGIVFLPEVQQVDSLPGEEAAPVSVVITQPTQPHAMSSIEPTPVADASARLPVPGHPHKTDGSSDLSELSDGDEKRARLAATGITHTPLPHEPVQTEAPEEDSLSPDRYTSGTLVWAKQCKFAHCLIYQH